MKTYSIKKQIVSIATTLVLSAITLTGHSAQAQEVSPAASRFAALMSLKTVVSLNAKSTQRLEEKVQDYSGYYQSLRFFQLEEKNRTAQMNCIEIKTEFVSSALMLSAMLDVNGEALKQIPEINNDTTLTELSKITSYLHEAKAAQDSCSTPSASLVHVRKARLLITEVNSYLEKIQNELPK